MDKSDVEKRFDNFFAYLIKPTKKNVSNPYAVPSFVQAECQFVVIRSPCLMSGQRFLAILEKLKKSYLVFCVNKKI